MSEPVLLVVDDERHIRRVLQLSLGDAGYRVLEADSFASARAVLESERVDVLLTDLQLPDRSGLELLEEVHGRRPDLPVILITAYGTVETAVRAMRSGAFDYVAKPFRMEEIEALVARALGVTRAEREIAWLREAATREWEGIVGRSAAIRHVVEQVERVAPAPTSVLVTGETGSGKELVARAVHARSPRAGRLFVPVNCAAIPGELLEAELFGVARGAFTGATADRAGKFELADGGTLFLDEIGDMPAAMQAKLLRALQEGTIERLGSNAVRRVDVRVVAATHRDLERMVAEGAFRADLYYRLNVFPIHVPPLRERKDDVAPLAARAVERFAGRLGRRVRLAPDAVSRLEAYDWPGNVRELNNVLERAVLLARGEVIEAGDLPAPGPRADAPPPSAGRPLTLRAAVERAEREAIAAALRHTGDNKARAAALLGVSVRTLWYKLERFGMGHGPSHPG
ncbi:MAG TPA: sigma-54 dependent transcriptional regulator [Longimicrobium sp.]|nr:sigma-54 dependent transcriptional regulator [Longimicrobium sp.]